MISFTVLAPAPYLNANDGGHWAPRRQKVKAWRTAAHYNARSYTKGFTGQADVFVRLDVPDNRRRDPSNYMPTVKALVDGLTDAGWWPDDTPEWVHTNEPELRVVGRKAALTVTITVKERT